MAEESPSTSNGPVDDTTPLNDSDVSLSPNSSVDLQENPKSDESPRVPNSHPQSPSNQSSEDTSNIYKNKDEGNQLFAQGDLEGAIEKWSKSINSLSFILNKSKSFENDGVTAEGLKEYTNMYVTLCLNLSLAYLKTQEYLKCKQYCQYVLMYDDKSLKAHLRIVKADIKLRNYDQALANCYRGLDFHPEDIELLSLKKTINDLMDRYKKVEKSFYQKAFNNLEPDPRTEGDPLEQLQKSKLYAFNYKLFMFYYRCYKVLKNLFLVISKACSLLNDGIYFITSGITNFFKNLKTKLRRKLKRL